MKILATLLLVFIATLSIHAQVIEYNKDSWGNRYFLNGEKLKLWKLNQVIENKEALQLLNSAENHRIVGGIVGVAGGFMVGWIAADVLTQGEKEINWRLLIAGVGLSVVSLSFDNASKKRIREAVEIHNAQFDSSSLYPPAFRLRLEASSNKIGLIVDF